MARAQRTILDSASLGFNTVLSLQIRFSLFTYLLHLGLDLLSDPYAIETIPPFLMVGVAFITAETLFYTFVPLAGVILVISAQNIHPATSDD
jgi:hypothetical protein